MKWREHSDLPDPLCIFTSYYSKMVLRVQERVVFVYIVWSAKSPKTAAKRKPSGRVDPVETTVEIREQFRFVWDKAGDMAGLKRKGKNMVKRSIFQERVCDRVFRPTGRRSRFPAAVRTYQGAPSARLRYESLNR